VRLTRAEEMLKTATSKLELMRTQLQQQRALNKTQAKLVVSPWTNERWVVCH